ncbi:MAG: Uma2 family endonuclease [Minicystis sp.]
MVQRLPEGYVFDPADPRAPSDEQWDAMTPEERRCVVDMLPAQPDVDFLPPSEGDKHRKASTGALTTLDSFFRRDHRKIYISGNLSIYYPNERVFAPDVIAVIDVEPHERQRWVVRDEGKGIDFALEVLVSGDRAKDLKANVERYARLGIREYFVFDRGKLSLRGYRIDPARPRTYQPIVPQGGRFASLVLDLDLMIEGTTLRFYQTTAPLLDAEERIDRLATAFNEAIGRAADAEERAEAEAEARRIAEERNAELEQQVRELQAEIARLKGGGSDDRG